MNDNTDNIVSNENDVPSVTFIEWPLDEDDAEFRAGYPFSPVPSEELNEQEIWYDSSPTFDDNSFQLDNSLNDGFNETTEAKNDQSNHFSYYLQEELVEFDIKSSEIHNDSNVNAYQKQDHKEYETNQSDDQHSIEQTDNVNDKQINQAHSAK